MSSDSGFLHFCKVVQRNPWASDQKQEQPQILHISSPVPIYCPPHTPRGLNHYIDYKIGLQDSSKSEDWNEMMRRIPEAKAPEDTWKWSHVEVRLNRTKSTAVRQKSSPRNQNVLFIMQGLRWILGSLKWNNFADVLMISVETLLKHHPVLRKKCPVIIDVTSVKQTSSWHIYYLRWQGKISLYTISRSALVLVLR